MAVADVAAAEQGVGREGQDPVADLVADDPVARPGDVGQQRRVPPDVVGVDDDADRVGRELGGQVERLAEPADHAPVGGEDRVQRLDAEPDPVVLRDRDELGDRVGDQAPGQPDVAAAGNQAAGDEDERIGAERGRLGDRGLVVGDRGRAGDRVGVGEEAAPAQAGDRQPGRLDVRGGRGQPGPGDVLAPEPDRRDVMPDAQVDRLGDAELVDRRLVEGEPGESGHACSFRNAVIRPTARSGSVSAPAAAASSNTRIRCSADRLRSNPSSMEKRGWKPFSQARNATPVL